MDPCGTLSSDDFRVTAKVLIDKWTTVIDPDQPPWSWVPASSASHLEEEGEIRGYLALENLCPFKPCKEERAQCDKEDGFVDAANLVQHHDLTLHYYDLHIMYSDSYRVPVLYFRAYTNDGSPLCLDDVEKDLPTIYAKELSDSKWTFITQEEHPYLNRPWYKLHPCGTSEWIRLLHLGDSSLADRNRFGTELYLVSWLSVVGPMFGLKISIQARQQLIDEAEALMRGLV
ncbi:unnamed protein product [Rhodiola kirilowii]